jgi:hypothetical protein
VILTCALLPGLDLRHYAVSALIAQGANILQLARIAGQGDPGMTLRVCAHLMGDGLAETSERFDPLPQRTLVGRQ